MTKKELMKQIAGLESINDQLITELQMVDQLMRDVGFSNGLETIKATAQELQNNPEAYMDMEEDES